jgi:hypothetical protein
VDRGVSKAVVAVMREIREACMVWGHQVEAEATPSFTSMGAPKEQVVDIFILRA